MGFWQGKKVLVTGHTGFKGSWLSLWLHELGAEVTGYALAPNTEPSLFEILQLDTKITSVIADISDYKKLTEVIQQKKIEIILHLAAQPLVRRSYQSPVETYQTNVMGTVNILEAVRQSERVKVFLNVTTDKCYLNDCRKEGYQENDKLGGYDPYSSSKACSEIVTSSYRDSFFKDNVAIATARAGNVIGGGDWSQDRLIPDCVMSFIAHKLVMIRYPQAVRPWQHVLESLSGYLLLAERMYVDSQQYSSAWNFGPSQDEIAQVEDVVNYLVQHWFKPCQWQSGEQSEPHEADFLMIDSTKAKTQLGWQSRWNVYQALDKVIEWYTAWNDGADMAQFTAMQIKQYGEIKTI